MLTHAGSVFAFGINIDGQLGLDEFSPEDHETPQPVPLPPGEIAIQVAAGGDYSLILTESGALYVAGDYEAPIVAAEATGLEAIPSFCTRRITQISAGNEHCVALDEDGCAWSWATQTEGTADAAPKTKTTNMNSIAAMFRFCRSGAVGCCSGSKFDWPFVEPTLVNSHYRASKRSPRAASSARRWAHGRTAQRTPTSAPVLPPWVFFGGVGRSVK